jgi:hypothetical protein
MTRNTSLLLVALLLLGGLSLYLNRDRFRSDPIQISHRSMPPRGPTARARNAPAPAVDPLIFMFNRPIRLTSVKVIPARNLETNASAHALWELVADGRSATVKDIRYGAIVPGRKPAVQGAVAEPLQPNVNYRLLIKAGSFEGHHDFTCLPRMP